MLFERLASRVLGLDGSLRAGADTLRTNQLGQPGLWRHWISGDLPILLVRVAGDDGLAARQTGAPGAGVLASQGSERGRRDRQRAPGRLSRRDPGAAHGRPRRRPMEHVEAPAGRRVPAPGRSPDSGRARPARRCRGSDSQRRSRRPPHSARPSGRRALAGRPSRADESTARPRSVVPSRRFPSSCWPMASAASPTTRRRMRSCSRARTRRRCRGSNVIANPHFGTIVTGSGSAHTWAGNSRENRLTPFANDPVTRPDRRRRCSFATMSRAKPGRRLRVRWPAAGRGPLGRPAYAPA